MGKTQQPVVVTLLQILAENFQFQSRRARQMVQLDHKSYVVVGVAAPRFNWYSADAYMPLKLGNDRGA